MMTYPAARTSVEALLTIADADTVERAIDTSRREARQLDSYTAEQDGDYATLKLALSDLTGRDYRR